MRIGPRAPKRSLSTYTALSMCQRVKRQVIRWKKRVSGCFRAILMVGAKAQTMTLSMMSRWLKPGKLFSRGPFTPLIDAVADFPVTPPVKELSDLLNQVKDEQSYIVVRERTHRNTAESTNGRVKWWSIFQLGVLLGEGIFQVWWLKRFFEVGFHLAQHLLIPVHCSFQRPRYLMKKTIADWLDPRSNASCNLFGILVELHLKYWVYLSNEGYIDRTVQCGETDRQSQCRALLKFMCQILCMNYLPTAAPTICQLQLPLILVRPLAAHTCQASSCTA